MQFIIAASIGALGFGALATFLIARFLSDDVMLNGAQDGRYAYLGKDEVTEPSRSARLERRLALQRPVEGVIPRETRASRRAIRRQGRQVLSSARACGSGAADSC